MTNIYRRITEHQVDECDNGVRIQAVVPIEGDQAPNQYWLSYDRASTCLSFQDGVVPEVGTNGINAEALLAVLADRLRCFQEGRFACEENAIALICVERALKALHQRTLNRQARGVEGTCKP